jgi:superfamily II DNA/RNA helicase
MPDKSKRQNLMFSATFENDIKQIAKKFMNDYYFVTNNQEVRANENIEQILEYAENNDKVYKLHEYLQKIKGSVISK